MSLEDRDTLDAVKDSLIGFFSYKRKIYKDLEKQVKRASNMDEIMYTKKDILMFEAGSMPISAGTCYFCIMFSDNCYICQYGKLKGFCHLNDSVYGKITKTLDDLCSSINEYWKKGYYEAVNDIHYDEEGV